MKSIEQSSDLTGRELLVLCLFFLKKIVRFIFEMTIVYGIVLCYYRFKGTVQSIVPLKRSTIMFYIVALKFRLFIKRTMQVV